MPYFITDKSPDCSGWATVKEDGEVLGATKEDQRDDERDRDQDNGQVGAGK